MSSALIIQVGAAPPYSCDNCVQELIAAPNGYFTRSMNGKLIFCKTSDSKRYRSVITCRDYHTLSGVWAGMKVRIGCVQSVWQHSTEAAIKLERDYVEDSLCVVDKEGHAVPFECKDNVVCVNRSSYDVDEVFYVSYRPWLDMHITDFKSEYSEWGMTCVWRLDLEEV